MLDNISGKTVTHKIFGLGEIISKRVSKEDVYIQVKFKDRSVEFQYPDIFEELLKADDIELAEQAAEDIRLKKAEEEKKLLEQQPNKLIDNPGSSQKKKYALLAIVGVICLALITILVAQFLANQHQEQEYLSQIDLGIRYLSEGNYQEAILAFNAAIEIDPKRADAYIGLADAYVALGDLEQAQRILVDALEVVKDPDAIQNRLDEVNELIAWQEQYDLGIRYLSEDNYQGAISAFQAAIEIDPKRIEAYVGLANAYLELGDINAAIDVLERALDITWDEEIAAWLEALKSMIGTASIQGTVSEYLPGGGSAPLPGARVRIYSDKSRLLRTITTDENGAFELTDLASGSVTLHVDAEGHIGLVTTENLEADAVNYTELYLLIPMVSSAASDDFYATVTNAINDEGVPGAEVRLRQGWNNTEGTMATSDIIIADDHGSIYIPDLDFGYYTAEVRADGFVTSFHNVAVVPQEFYAEWKLPMSPRLAEGETRIVLTWGEIPRDLDSHLYNDDFHVFYANEDFYQDGEHLVNLDLDDTSSYGPETVTIYRQLGKDCTYYVYDYTNGGYSNNTQLSTSGATVRVYQTDGLVATFHVPTGLTGDRWTVFTITAEGRIVPENTIGMDDYDW